MAETKTDELNNQEIEDIILQNMINKTVRLSGTSRWNYLEMVRGGIQCNIIPEKSV